MQKLSNKKIYFSGSIQGINHTDPNFGYNLVSFMTSLGFKVLSEHVAARSRDEQDNIFMKNTGVDRSDISGKELWENAYKVDMNWVDEADYLVALVDGPSHGVGMEIMRALLKEERGMNQTKILCLTHKDNFDMLSWMLKGIPESYSNFTLETYSDLDSAKSITKKFLSV